MKIAVVLGHPDPSENRLNRALANHYCEAARAGGHDVCCIDVARLDFPMLRVAQDFYEAQPPQSIEDAQRKIAAADHLVFFYPLWMGDVPALLKAFLEQTFRPGFALAYEGRRFPKGLLCGKSARLVVTMGMPAVVYRTYFGAHALKNLAINLRRCGVAPVYETLLGGVGDAGESRRRKWLDRMSCLARRDVHARSKLAQPARIVAAAGLAVVAGYVGYVALTWARYGRSRSKNSLLDLVMPEYDVRLRHQTTVRAPAPVVFETMRRVGLQRSLVVRALFRLRSILLGGAGPEKPLPNGLLEQLEALGWRIIGEEYGTELVFGTVTQPWSAQPLFRGMSADEFKRFDEPGFVKIAITLRVDPSASNRAIAATETRVLPTDAASRARFRGYWAFLSPGIEIVRIILLAELKAESEAAMKTAIAPN